MADLLLLETKSKNFLRGFQNDRDLCEMGFWTGYMAGSFIFYSSLALDWRLFAYYWKAHFKMTTDILSQWEKNLKIESKETNLSVCAAQAMLYRARLLLLIALIREKDLLCEQYKKTTKDGIRSAFLASPGHTYYRTADDVIHFIDVNLSLTGELK